MVILKVFIIIFLTKSIKSLQVNFTCEHKRPYYVISSISENNENWCNVDGNLKIEDENVEIFAIKIPDKIRIEGFVAENKEILYFPKGLEDTFPNLNHLVIKNSNLKAIARKNLKNFKNLQYIDLSENEIEILEEKVFYFEKTILTIILKNNKIKFIHQLAFKSMGLSHLDLEGNICVNEKVTNSKDVELLVNSLNTKCSPIAHDEPPVHEISAEDAITNPPVTFTQIKHEISTKPIKISSDSNSSSKSYITYGLIIIFFSSLITIIIYTKNRKSSTNLDTELPKSKITKVESSAELFDLPKSDNYYQTEAVYEEINYESNFAIKECERHEIEDFYVETDQNEAVEESGSYTVVYKSTEDLS